jgi:CIC family chloride channel protein
MRPRNRWWSRSTRALRTVDEPSREMIDALLNVVQRGHARLRESDHLYMVVLACVIGAGGGFAAVALRRMIDGGNWICWTQATYTLDFIRTLPVWWKIGVPTIGMFLCALIVHYFSREAKGHGVPDVMEAVALQGGRIRPRVVFGKLFASAICIASGGSAGREGPIVQIGAAFGSTIGQWLGLNERRLRTLVGCGAAAGIAGTFNAPVAGALFALEIIVGDFGVSQFSPMVIASVVATVIGHIFLESQPAFVVPAYGIVSYPELFAYAALGVVAGAVAVAFVRVLYFCEDVADAIPGWPPLKAIVGGALVGLLACWWPEVYGVGYEAMREALYGHTAGMLLLLFVAAKIVAVSITLSTGGSGGIFAPSMFIGAMLGGAFGVLINSIWPESTAGSGAYALVGMVAVVAATTHAPITAIVIIFELTTDYDIMLPLMVSAILATLVARQLQTASIYTLKLLRRGVDIHAGQDLSLLKHLSVRDAMRTDFATVQPGASLMTVIAEFVDHNGSSIFVVDKDRQLLGVIDNNQNRGVMAEASELDGFIIAQDMMAETGFPVVRPDDSLAAVMKMLARFRGEVPVIDAGRLVGVIWPEDVMERYNAELFKREMAASMVASVRSDMRAEPIPTVEDTSLVEMQVPRAFVGRSVAELDVRNRCGVTVLLIKQRVGLGREVVTQVPTPEYVFKMSDVILAMGMNRELRALERGVIPALP